MDKVNKLLVRLSGKSTKQQQQQSKNNNNNNISNTTKTRTRESNNQQTDGLTMEGEEPNIEEDRPLWVRHLTEEEQLLEMMQSKHCNGILCYKMVLNTKKSKGLNGATVGRALTCLQRRCPHLRLCIKDKGSDGPWFQEMASTEPEYQLRLSEDVEEILEKEVKTPFKSEVGPLWRTNIIPILDKVSSFFEDKTLSKKYSDQCYILFSFHPAIADAITATHTCNLFLKIINDLLENKSVDTGDQLGVFSEGEDTKQLLQKRKAKLDADERRKESIMADISKLSQLRPLITKAFQISETQKRNTTLHLHRELSRDQSTKLFAFLKEECLTVNSGFLAIANLSLIAMFQKRGFKEKMYHIPSYNAVNFRRYWTGDTSRTLGTHFGSICLVSDTPADSAHSFLEYAHDIQTNMQDYLSNNRVFDEKLFLDLLQGTQHKNFDEFFSDPPENPQFFHITTNVGSLGHIFNGEGKYAQVSHFDMYNSIHRYNSTFLNAIQTFRGRLCVSVDYNARVITTQVAEEYMDTMFKFLLDIVNQM